MTLIKTSAQIQEHVTVNFNFAWAKISPFVKQAERQYIKSFIGSTLYTDWDTTAPTTGKAKEAYDLFIEASANLAMLKYVPQGNVSVSDGGIQTNSNEFAKPAEWWQIRDLQRAFETNGLSAIDEALVIMEDNESDFSDWVGTEGYTIFKELFTPKTQDFQRFFNINSSRRTFLALRPYIYESQEQVFNWIDDTTLDTIKAARSAPPELAFQLPATLIAGGHEDVLALRYLQGAQVNHTVAKAASSGMFLLKSSGMFTRSEEASLSNTKIDKLSEEELYRLKQDRTTAGDEYLKKLKEFLLEHPDKFPDFVDPSTTPIDFFVHNTKSIVAF